MFAELLAKILAWFEPKQIAVMAAPAPQLLQVTVAGLSLVKQFESCRLVSYKDGAGIWTLGWGHTQDVAQGMTCTQQQADEWFEQDIASVSKIVAGLLPSGINANQFSACVSLAYNIGTGRFASSTLLKMIRAGDFAGASAQFLRWDKIESVPDDGLLKRRTAEQQLFNTPVV